MLTHIKINRRKQGCKKNNLRSINAKQRKRDYHGRFKESEYEDTNSIFESAERHDVDYHVAKWFEDTHTQLVPIIERYMKKQNTTPIGYVAYRLEEGDV